MSWLVIGASGQLGRAICTELEERGINFHIWNREQGSIGVKNFVDSYLSLIKPEVIINCAAWTDVDGAEENEESARIINVEAVRYLVEASKNLNATFVHVSTDYVFSGHSNVPWIEIAEKQPLSAYGRTKAAGEDKVNEIYSEKSYIFRTSWLYSKNRKNFVKTMIRRALENQPSEVVNDQFGNPTFCGDLAVGIIDSITNKIPFGTYHLTNTEFTTWFDFAQEIYRAVGADPSLVKAVSTSKLNSKVIRPTYSVLSNDKWISTGMKPLRSWRKSLVEAIPSIINEVKSGK